MALVGATEPHDAFFEKLTANWKKYRKWAKESLLDVSEMELWLQYLLPDYPAERVVPNAARLTRLWRDHDGRRVVHEDANETLRELKNRGYRLGIISNLIGENEIPDWLRADGLDRYFDSVVLSSVCHIRKPDPRMYRMGCDELGLRPEECASVADNLDRDGLRPYFKSVQQSPVCLIRKPHPAIYYYALAETGAEPARTCYVADNLDRDITGAKAVSLDMTVGVQYPDKKPQTVTDANRPDVMIHHFSELLDIFPGLNEGGK